MTAGSACGRGMPTHQPYTTFRQLLSMQDWFPEFYLFEKVRPANGCMLNSTVCTWSILCCVRLTGLVQSYNVR
jgi:hypothetical protein